MTIGDIMSREVIAVEPENTLREVLEILTTLGITGAPVISAGHVMGVISRTDIVEFLASTPPVPSLRPQLAEWGEIESDREETPDDESYDYFRGFWLDSGADLVERFDEPDGPEWDLLAEYTASTIMTRTLETLSPDASLTEAAGRLIDRGIHRILIVDHGKLCGIVSATDLIRVMANPLNTIGSPGDSSA